MSPDDTGASWRPGLRTFLRSVMTLGTTGGTSSITISALQERLCSAMCALVSRGKGKIKFVPPKDRKANTAPVSGFENVCLT